MIDEGRNRNEREEIASEIELQALRRHAHAIPLEDPLRMADGRWIIAVLIPAGTLATCKAITVERPEDYGL